MGMGIKKPPPGAAGGGTSSSGGKVIVATTMALEELEEETGHVCVVCGEGETYRPGEVMGCYAFCRRVGMLSGGVGSAGGHALSPGRIGGGGSGGGGLGVALGGGSEMCYTSVTHFNLIHFSCHRDATRAERSLKQPKEEWEGATLRNSQTKCNNLLPIHSASVSDEAYMHCVEQWWAHMVPVGRVDAPRCRLVAHSISNCFCCALPWKSRSRLTPRAGGESNIKMVPYLIQMANALLDARAAPQRRSYQRTLAAFTNACVAISAPGSKPAEAVAGRRRRQHSDGGGDSARGRQRHQ